MVAGPDRSPTDSQTEHTHSYEVKEEEEPVSVAAREVGMAVLEVAQNLSYRGSGD